jgi:alkylation response protein AidB-like acyl-CoA dehydrogenase
MDFSFTSDQEDLQGLARQILTDATTIERVKSVLATDTAVDTELWKQLAASGLVGIALPESVGGGGLGFIEASIVLQEVGRAASPVPALAVIGLGGPALAEFGGERFLEGVADGDRIVTAALIEPVGDPRTPATTATDGRLTGEKICVPAGLVADVFVVSTSDGLYAVRRDGEGVTIERQETTTGVPEAHLVLSSAPATKLSGPEGVGWLIDRAATSMSVMMAGVCDSALRLTAEYAKSRVQFERPIATFQAVSQRAADAYIDTEAVRLTAWQAAWRLAEGKPHDEQVAVAKFWAAEGGQRVVHAAHHIHGGVGVDRDYPLHRYFLLAKQLELSLGSATPSLQRLGKLLAGAQ